MQLFIFYFQYDSLKAYKDDKMKKIYEKHLQTLQDLNTKFEETFTAFLDHNRNNKELQVLVIAYYLVL